MTDKTRWELAKKLITTLGPSLEKIVWFLMKCSSVYGGIEINMKRYRENIEDRPEVRSALERVFKAQEALRNAALQVQSQRGFSALDKRFDRESYMDIIEAPRRALQQANDYLSAVSAWACEKAGCYD